MQYLQNALQLLCEQVDDEVSFRNDYSGRGMYGKSCVGITGSKSGCMQIIAEVIKASVNDTEMTVEEVVDMLLNFEQDSMGLDVILYWPDLEPLEADSEDID